MEPTDLRALAAEHGGKMLERYRVVQQYLSAAAWTTLCLHYQGMTNAQIAHIMKRSPSSISGRLGRARKMLEQKEAEMRQERYELLRKREEE